MEIESSATLGVAWYGLSTDEVDIALDIGHPWFTDGQVYYDVETVLLHENGHGLGLGHSSVSGSIMQAFYGGVQRTLGTDDINGISALYPAPEDTTPVDPAISITSPTTLTVNGKITISASVVGVSSPQVLFVVSDPSGIEILSQPDNSAPFQTSIHTKNWETNSPYLIQVFETTGSNLDASMSVEKAGKTTDDSGGTPNCNGKSKKPECR